MAIIKKTDHGLQYSAGAYLYVPDPESPSSWKLRVEETPGKITIAQLGRVAAALGPGFMGQRVQLPPGERKKAARKLIGLYRKQGVADSDIPPYLWAIAGMSPRVSAKKDEGEWIIEGWGAPYGSPEDKDADGEFFAPDTDFGLKLFPTRPVIFHHGLTESSPEPIGREVAVEKRDGGIWVRLILDPTKELARKAWELAQKGQLFFSSGAISHLVRSGENGKLLKWPIAEWSLTPRPANKHAIAMAAAKTQFAAIGLVDWPKGLMEEPPAGAKAPGKGGENIQNAKGAISMEDRNIQKQVEAALAHIKAQEQAKAEAEELKALRAKTAEQETKLKELEAQRKIPFPTGLEVKGTVWEQMEPADRELAGLLLAKQGKPLSPELKRAIKGGLEENMPKFKAFLNDAEIKAIALMDTSDTSNWVPANYEARIWDRLRLQNRVAGLFRQINMPTDSYNLPVSTAGPTVYTVPEQTAGTPTLSSGITTSQVSDAKVTLATKKLGAATWFSGELDEDSIIPIMPLIRDQMGKAMDEAVENVLLNGDQTTGTGNISVASAASTDAVVAVDGLRHFGLVDATTYSVDVGTLTADDFMTLRSTMGKYGINPEEVAFITDYNTIYKAWALDEVMTLDKMGPNAVLLKGQLASIFGSPIIVSGQMNKFGTDGKYAASPTKGIIIAVHRPSWVIGWRRRLKFGVNYFDNVDATRVTALLRIAFKPFSTSAGHACVGYDVAL